MELPLAIWFSPMFPIGAFAYSHGLEWACEAGDIRDAESLRAWLDALVTHGALANDAILLAAAFRAAAAKSYDAISDVNELALALATSRERHLETTTQGHAFRRAIATSWPCETLSLLADDEIAFPVGVALAAVGHDLPLDKTLDMFCLGFVQNLVSAAIRLGAIGQTAGQQVIAALLPAMRDAARAASTKTLDDLGACAFRSDLASLRHEAQYTRLFRS